MFTGKREGLNLRFTPGNNDLKRPDYETLTREIFWTIRSIMALKSIMHKNLLDIGFHEGKIVFRGLIV